MIAMQRQAHEEAVARDWFRPRPDAETTPRARVAAPQGASGDGKGSVLIL